MKSISLASQPTRDRETESKRDGGGGKQKQNAKNRIKLSENSSKLPVKKSQPRIEIKIRNINDKTLKIGLELYHQKSLKKLFRICLSHSSSATNEDQRKIR